MVKYLPILFINVSQTKVILLSNFNFLADLVKQNLTLCIFLQIILQTSDLNW